MSTRVAVTAANKLLLSSLEAPVSLVRELRRADDFIKLAVVSAGAAIDTAGKRDLATSRIGLFIGTAYGPLETNFCSLGSLIDDGEGQISPTLFSHSVYNAAAGYVSRLLDIHGPALTITTYTWPFLTALNQARLAILSGRIERAVVVAVETYSSLLEDAYRRWHGKEEVPWQPGAVSWVLDPAKDAGENSCIINQMRIDEQPAEPGLLLARTGEHWQGDKIRTGDGTHPLAYAYAFTDAVNQRSEDKKSRVRWELSAAFGKAWIEMEI
ncbi:MAG: beta-ketoacyl synthase chain length factor [Proteobacteria bacterium]|nr:beta-ketoacyl synthase chain length factor [Pseudomonadota bacterium]MBU1710678.1 beta-ketoacyl synthase chain length factor [Pseudomonadota bacterium]